MSSKLNEIRNSEIDAAAVGCLHVETITHVRRFIELQSEWDRLIEESNVGSIFLTWDWLYTWWEIFSGNDDLCLITVRDNGGNLVGIGPFYVSKRWNGSMISAIAFLGGEPISSDYMDIICHSGSETPVAEAILRAVVKYAETTDCLIFSDILDDSLICRLLKTSDIARGFRQRVDNYRICPYVDVSGGRDAVFNGLSRVLRSIIRRKTKKQEEMGFRFVRVLHEDEVDFYVQELFLLHQRCWNQRGLPGNFGDEAVRSFHKKASVNLFRKGRLRVYALVHDSVIAVLYGFEFKGRFSYFQSGYDPDWSAYSPGTVLMGHVIGAAISDRLSVFDFLRGDENYKSMWATRSRRTISLVLIPRTGLKAAIYFLLRDFRKAIRFLGKSVFHKSQGEG